MTTTPSTAVTRREPELPGQTVVIIGGSAGIGLETARRARAEGAEVILAARRPAGLADVQAGTRAPTRVSTGAPGRCGRDRGYHARPTPWPGAQKYGQIRSRTS